MPRIIALSGSLRKASFNTALLRAAAERFPEAIFPASIEGIPLYNADLESSQGIPGAVAELKNLIIPADGLLIATPEYNNSVPGVLKNAIDWLSRPTEDIPKVFGRKPVAIIGASPGGFGTVSAQSAWLPVFRTLRAKPFWGERLMVSRAGGTVNEAGDISDETTLRRLEEFVGGFIEFCSD